jgi:hypothetical protein
MKILIIIFCCIWAWIIYDVINAPLVDENGNIIEDNNKKK